MAHSPAVPVVDMMIVFGLPAWAVTRYWPRVEPVIASAAGSGTVGEVVAFLALLAAIAAAIAVARVVWAAITGRRV